jgi:hypothetical protein
MDQMFGTMMVQPNLAVQPPLQGLVAKAVMDTAEGRRRYFERMHELNQSLLDVDTLTNRILQYTARLRPVLTEISPSVAANHQREAEDLCDRIVQRKHSLEDQLGGTKGALLEFDSDGVARLAGWTSLTNAGRPLLVQKLAEGRPVVLQISAQGTSVASWRARVLLEEGHYSFEGRMQTKGIDVDPRDRRAGAGLRVSDWPSFKKTRADTDWTAVAFEFDVPGGLHDVELVCELRAAGGEVWFDADSLRLVRK